MALPVQIPGFPSSNRAPGAIGQVVFGVGGQSAANLPKKLLVVGLMLAGAALTPDTQVAPIGSPTDADFYAGVGSELACMLYDAVALGAALGVQIYAASPKPANGATQASTSIRFGGTATQSNQVAVRVNGKQISTGVAVGDNAATVAANLSGAVNGYLAGRSPVSATNTGNYCVLQCRTPGIRGNQHVVVLDVSQLPAGITATLYVTWTASQVWAAGDQVVPAIPNGFYYQCTSGGTGTSGTPSWPTTVGSTVADGSATFTCWGTTASGSLPSTALFLGSGTGLESYTNELVSLTSQAYDRIPVACNDATSLAAWKTQVDVLAAAPVNFLQQVQFATNGSLAAHQSLTQTTVNDPRFQGIWMLNAETHPSRIASALGAIRAGAEQSNPNASYDGYVMTTVAPQAKKADWPQLPTLIAAINSGVTVVGSQAGDGLSRICRSVTTKCLTGGFADYSTIDTGMVTVPDFVLQDGKLLYTSIIQPNNPVCQDDPPLSQKEPPAGVFTPRSAVSLYTAKLINYSIGVLSNSPVVGSASVPPIIIAPIDGDVSAVFDPVAQRIMLSETIRVMPINHQLGLSIQQSI